MTLVVKAPEPQPDEVVGATVPVSVQEGNVSLIVEPAMTIPSDVLVLSKVNTREVFVETKGSLIDSWGYSLTFLAAATAVDVVNGAKILPRLGALLYTRVRVRSGRFAAPYLLASQGVGSVPPAQAVAPVAQVNSHA